MAKSIKAKDILSYIEKDTYSFLCFENPNVDNNGIILSWIKSAALKNKDLTFLIVGWINFFQDYDLRNEKCDPNDIVVLGFKRILKVVQNPKIKDLEDLLRETMSVNKQPSNLRLHLKLNGSSKLYHLLLKPCWATVNEKKHKKLQSSIKVSKVLKVVEDDDNFSDTSTSAHVSIRLGDMKKTVEPPKSSQQLKQSNLPKSNRNGLNNDEKNCQTSKDPKP